jgi:hypothetical protein
MGHIEQRLKGLSFNSQEYPRGSSVMEEFKQRILQNVNILKTFKILTRNPISPCYTREKLKIAESSKLKLKVEWGKVTRPTTED